jgi:DNA-binding Xre family transcriptional regulator
MTIDCKLRVLLARANVERAKQGRPVLSLRRLAYESGVSLSVISALHTGKNQRIDYTTIDQLLNYFSQYFPVTTDDLLSWVNSGADDVGALAIIGLQEQEGRERAASR